MVPRCLEWNLLALGLPILPRVQGRVTGSGYCSVESAESDLSSSAIGAFYSLQVLCCVDISKGIGLGALTEQVLLQLGSHDVAQSMTSSGLVRALLIHYIMYSCRVAQWCVGLRQWWAGSVRMVAVSRKASSFQNIDSLSLERFVVLKKHTKTMWFTSMCQQEGNIFFFNPHFQDSIETSVKGVLVKNYLAPNKFGTHDSLHINLQVSLIFFFQQMFAKQLYQICLTLLPQPLQFLL